VLSHVYPAAGSPELSRLVPETLAWGFVGAFFASVLAIIEEFHTYNLTPGVYYSLMFRLLFSSTAAFLVGQAVKDSFSPVLAFGVGLFPIEQTWNFISDKTAQGLGAAKPEGEKGAGLAAITGPGGQQGPAKAGQSRHHNGSGSGYRRPAAVVLPYDVTDPDGGGLDR
jgi:hypothetical protein